MKREDNQNDTAFHAVLLDTLPEAVTMVNRDGIVVNWNKAAAELYDISPSEILGKRISDFSQRCSLLLFQVMDSGVPVYGVYHQPRPDKHVFIDTVPVLDEHGQLAGAVSIERDITDVVKLSEERYSHQVDRHRLDLSPLLNSSQRELQTTLKFLEQMHTTDPMSALMIQGESGAGKTMLARYAHQLSHIKGPFLTLACKAFPEGYLDIELFGHHRDIYSDHRDEKIGKLELAGHGTLYLTDVEALPQRTQMKLAKAIQDRGFTKNGGTQWVPLNSRIIASTGENGSAEIEPKLLHELYFQFHHIYMPPLRQRRQDLPELCHYYLTQAAERLHKPVPQLGSEVMAAMMTHHWPGNIQELIRVMEHLVIVSNGEEPLTLENLPRSLRPRTMNDITDDAMPLASLSEEMERAKIEDTLAQTGGNKASAARLLGISRGALYYKLRQYDIN